MNALPKLIAYVTTQNNGEARLSNLTRVTGPTGAGKTTFVNNACKSRLKVGHGLQSCTTAVQTASCKINGETVTLIDTPGFDDSSKSQAEIFKDIADYLEQTYMRGVKLSGVIYLHRISDLRIGGIARQNFRLFTKLIGDNTMKNVMLATTMWEDVSERVGADRERELATNSRFFKTALDQGARMARLHNTSLSAKAIIEPFFRSIPAGVQIQHELVDDHVRLPETAAALELRSALDRQTEEHQEQIRNLLRVMQAEMDQQTARHQKRMQELEQKLAKTQEELEKLGHSDDNISELPRDVGAASGWSGIHIQFFLGIRRRPNDRVQIRRRRDGRGCIDDNGFEL